MKFLDYSGTATPNEIKACFDEYAKYLDENRTSIPPDAFEFATADWHYDFMDSKCPHDSWLRKLEIIETGVPTHRNDRTLDIRIVLLGAYHDGFITLRHRNVHSYILEKPNTSGLVNASHGDWLIDEVTLTDDSRLCHEIKFANASPWIIVCDDIKYSWRQVRVRDPF